MTLSLHRANESSRIVSALNHLNENLLRQEEIKSDAWRKNTLFWIAEGYYSIQDYKHAEQTYRRFVELAPDHPMIPYALEGLGASLAAQATSSPRQGYVDATLGTESASTKTPKSASASSSGSDYSDQA